MAQHTTTATAMTRGAGIEQTIGLDVGDRHTYLCVLDAAREVVEEGRVRTTPEGVRQRFGAVPRARVVLETGTHSRWPSALVNECGHEVVVANARRLRLIAEHDGKSDRTDAETLARLGRVDPALLAPIRHRARATHADLAVVRARDAVVRVRTLLVNHVRGAVKAVGARVPASSPPAFARRARAAVPEELAPALGPVFAVLEDLNRVVAAYDRAVAAPFSPDCTLRRWGLQLAPRGGRNAKKRAVVAVARKLAVLLHRLWVPGEQYEPLRGATDRPEGDARDRLTRF